MFEESAAMLMAENAHTSHLRVHRISTLVSALAGPSVTATATWDTTFRSTSADPREMTHSLGKQAATASLS